MSRWIAQSVDMLDHPVIGMDVPPPPAADKTKHAQPPVVAWQDLLRSARWADGVVPHKGQSIALKRGEFLAGRAHWAKRWNWGEQAVRSFFARLVENKMIEISNQSFGHTASIASICNYKKYQSVKHDAQPVEKPEPNQSQTRGQPEGNQNITRNTLLTDSTRDAEKPTALGLASIELKSAFNGQTEILLGDVQRWLGPTGRRDNAIKWLSGTLSAYGQVPTIQAHQMLIADEANGKVISNPLVVWSKAAGTMRDREKKSAPSKFRQPEEIPHRVSTETRMNLRPAGYPIAGGTNGR
jgi:hypothetical protein